MMTHRLVAFPLVLCLAAGCATQGGSGSAAPSIPQNVATEAARIGADPAALLSRVSDGVATETYPGAFRGSGATLADGAGNAYDKAILLHDLLRSAAPALPVRYASCTLADDKSDAVLAAASAAYTVAPIAANTAAALAAAKDAPARATLQHIAALWSGTVVQLRDESAKLAADLHGAKAPAGSPPASPRAVAADHVWIQVQRNGSWTDLDPTLPKAKPGDVLCVPVSTSDALADEAYDTVTATLRYETRTGATVAQSEVARVARRAVDLSGTTLSFAFVPPAGKGPLAMTPVLRVGTDEIAAPAIVLPTPIPDVAPGSSTTKKEQGAVDFFAASTPPTATPEPAATAAQVEPVALWLDVTVTARGETPQTVTETIFDRVAYADRAAGAAATAKLPEWDDNGYVPFATVWNVATNLGTAVAGAGDRSRIDPRASDDASIARQLGGLQRAYYTLRRAAYADERAGTPSAVIAAAPGVSLAGIAAHSFDGLVAPVLTMDVASDAARPEGGDATASAAWGAASLIAERTVVNAAALFKAAAREIAPADVPAVDVIAVFDAARKGAVATSLVRSTSDVDALGAPADAKARLDGLVRSGAVALVPAAPVTLPNGDDYGWWIVAPDGSIRDEMQNGMHTEGVDYTTIAAKKVDEAEDIRRRSLRNRRAVQCAIVVISFFQAIGGAPEATSAQGSTLGAAEEISSIEERYAEASSSVEGDTTC